MLNFYNNCSLIEVQRQCRNIADGGRILLKKYIRTLVVKFRESGTTADQQRGGRPLTVRNAASTQPAYDRLANNKGHLKDIVFFIFK